MGVFSFPTNLVRGFEGVLFCSAGERFAMELWFNHLYCSYLSRFTSFLRCMGIRGTSRRAKWSQAYGRIKLENWDVLFRSYRSPGSRTFS